MGSVFKALAPTRTMMGYALFLAINAAGVWGGVFPFLPMGFQTGPTMLRFSIVQSAVFCLCFIASAAGAFFYPKSTQRFKVRWSAAPYMLGWVALIAAVYADAHADVLVTAAGALLGMGSAGFYMLWQRLLSSEPADRCNRNLILGTAWASLIYFCLTLLPRAVTIYLIPVVFTPLFCLAIVLETRAMDLAQPMFEDDPRENKLPYGHTVRGLWRGAFGIGSIGFCAGMLRYLAIDEASVGAVLNMASMISALIAALAVFALWNRRGVKISATAIYGLSFPLIVCSLVAVPFLGSAYVYWLAAGFYALFTVATFLMMVQCAQISRDRGINPVFVYGVYGFMVYAMHGLGYAAGNVSGCLGGVEVGLAHESVAVVVSLGMLALVHFFGMGGFYEALRHDIDTDIELLVPISAPRIATPISIPGTKESPTQGHVDDVRRYQDRLSKRVDDVRLAHGLTEREAEVMELIARGYTVKSISERLVLSENTVRSYSKRLYAKLEVHKKSELIAIVAEPVAPDMPRGAAED